MRAIAINAQLNPIVSGGVETNLQSLLGCKAIRAPDLSIKLLAIERYMAAIRDISPANAETVQWRWGQDPIKVRRTIFDGWLARQSPPVRQRKIERWRVKTEMRHDDALKKLAAKGDAELKRLGVGAVHFPASYIFSTALPFLYEPWDLQHRHYPQFFTIPEYKRREFIYRRGCERAALVITATQWIKDDIVRLYGIERSKIAVIPRASILTAKPLSDAQRRASLTGLGVPDRFIFYPAMTFPHKNHVRLFQALALLRDKRGMDLTLVMSGRMHKPYWPEVAKHIQQFRLGDRVRVLGRVSENQLTALFQSAQFMVFPSLFEGLGLPLLEAFMHRLPVLAAAATSIPEVVGDAAMLFDPNDPEAIANAIETALNDPTRLNSLVEKGVARLAEFDWDVAGPKFAACYRHVLGAPLDAGERAWLDAALC
jgi:glycosyltransferase involved in cell wall biosynthesis